MGSAAIKRKRIGEEDVHGGQATSSPSSSSKRAAIAKSRSRDSRKLKRDTEEAEIDALERAVASFNTPKNYSRFEHLPLSRKTLQGLKKAGYSQMTDIQAKSLPLSLRSRDLLGAARTGSGKTLAFLIPVLERLFRAKWGPNDGLGALVISPTRELAIQIFEVLRKIGSAHTYSAGLVIGGKDFKQEKDRLNRMNILVATPGRLLQHMDQTVGFDCSNLQVLVLDEADRILDMGFSNTLNAIIENLPKDRQTLLFSATQTKRVKDLARLNLKEPEYVAVREHEGEAGNGESLTPKNLDQHYMVVPLEQKLNMLFSFLRSHTKSKLLVFFSSCRQVQFAHEVFCKLRPGMSLMALHGKQKQAKRLQIFTDFTRTSHAALFATDIAARGLDFPAVDWVLQTDAPEDVDTYVHRVGRTARYQAKGNSLMFLLPSEEKGMNDRLASKNIFAGLLKPRESKTQSIQNQLQSFLFQSPELKYLAQKTFISYIRSVYLQKDKGVFDVLALPLEDYAASLGLPGAPKVKFVKEASAARKKADAKARALEKQVVGDQVVPHPSKDAENTGQDTKNKTKYDRMFARQNQGVLSEHYAKLVSEEKQESPETDDYSTDGDLSEDEDDMSQHGTKEQAAASWTVDDDNPDDENADFLTLKRRDHGLDGDDGEESAAVSQTKSSTDAPHEEETSYHLSKRKLQQGQSKKAMAAAGKRGAGTKLTFDDEGVAHELYELQDEAAFKQGGSAAEQARRFVEDEAVKLKQQDVEDKERVKEKRREKKRKEKGRERAGNAAGSGNESEDGGPTVLAPEDNRDDGYETPDFELESGSDGADSSDNDGPPEAEQATGRKRKQSGDRKPRSEHKTRIDRNISKSTGLPASEILLADEELALRILQN